MEIYCIEYINIQCYCASCTIVTIIIFCFLYFRVFWSRMLCNIYYLIYDILIDSSLSGNPINSVWTFTFLNRTKLKNLVLLAKELAIEPSSNHTTDHCYLHQFRKTVSRELPENNLNPKSTSALFSIIDSFLHRF